MKINDPLFVTLALFITSGAAWAAGGVVSDPTGVAPDRYVYYPGTEELDEGQIRIVACGTGMPDQRLGQASACFLFELGNGGLTSNPRRPSVRTPRHCAGVCLSGARHITYLGDIRRVGDSVNSALSSTVYDRPAPALGEEQRRNGAIRIRRLTCVSF